MHSACLILIYNDHFYPESRETFLEINSKIRPGPSTSWSPTSLCTFLRRSPLLLIIDLSFLPFALYTVPRYALKVKIDQISINRYLLSKLSNMRKWKPLVFLFIELINHLTYRVQTKRWLPKVISNENFH